MRSKELELEQAQESFRKMQWLKQQSDEKHTITLRERDNIIAQLHTTLHARSKETEVNIQKHTCCIKAWLSFSQFY